MDSAAKCKCFYVLTAFLRNPTIPPIILSQLGVPIFLSLLPISGVRRCQELVALCLVRCFGCELPLNIAIRFGLHANRLTVS
jgi:hypothetical protein